VGHTRGIVEEGFAGLLRRRHGEEGEAAQVGEMVASAQGHHHLASPRFGGSGVLVAENSTFDNTSVIIRSDTLQ
jgi:hypothetical protein